MDILNQISTATGVAPKKLLNYAMIGGVVLVMLGVGQSYITQMIAVLYPCFMSFVALETDTPEDDKQWLTYWVCYGAFAVIDQFAGFILSFIPFYYFLKMAFLIWCMHPSSQGATIVYNQYILPFYMEHEGEINQMEKMAEDKLHEAEALAGARSFIKKD